MSLDPSLHQGAIDFINCLNKQVGEGSTLAQSIAYLLENSTIVRDCIPDAGAGGIDLDGGPYSVTFNTPNEGDIVLTDITSGESATIEILPLLQSLIDNIDFTILEPGQCEAIFQCILDNGTEAQWNQLIDILCAIEAPPAPAGIVGASGTLPNGVDYTLSVVGPGSLIQSPSGASQWDQNSILEIQFSEPVDFETVTPTDLSGLNPAVQQWHTSGGVSSGITTDSAVVPTYTPGAVDITSKLALGVGSATDNGSTGATGVAATDDWGTLLFFGVTSVQIQGVSTELMQFQVTIDGGKALAACLFDGLTGPDCVTLFNCIIENGSPAQFTEFIEQVNWSQMSEEVCTGIFQCIIQEGFTTQFNEFLNKMDFSELSTENCRAIFQCIIDLRDEALTNAFFQTFNFNQLTNAQVVDIRDMIGPLFTVNAGTTADAADDALGTAEVTFGDIVHFWSPDGTLLFGVTEGSAIVAATLNPTVLTGIQHTTITNIDLQPTVNPNEFTVEIEWTDGDGNAQTTTDPTPVTFGFTLTDNTLADYLAADPAVDINVRQTSALSLREVLRVHEGGGSNVALGVNSGIGNTGSNTLFSGSAAGQGNTANSVTGIGVNALRDSVNSQGGFAHGVNAARDANLLSNFLAVGQRALRGAGGNAKTALGDSAGQNSSGDHQVFLGDAAGQFNSGFNVFAAGRQAARGNAGSSVLALGELAGSSNAVSGAVILGAAEFPTYADHATAYAALPAPSANGVYVYRIVGDGRVYWRSTSVADTASGAGTDDQNATEVPITDPSDIFTATTVEGALAELFNLVNGLPPETDSDVQTATAPFTTTNGVAVLAGGTFVQLDNGETWASPIPTASLISIVDANGYLDATNVEDALAELAAPCPPVPGLGVLSALFQDSGVLPNGVTYTATFSNGVTYRASDGTIDWPGGTVTFDFSAPVDMIIAGQSTAPFTRISLGSAEVISTNGDPMTYYPGGVDAGLVGSGTQQLTDGTSVSAASDWGTIYIPNTTQVTYLAANNEEARFFASPLSVPVAPEASACDQIQAMAIGLQERIGLNEAVVATVQPKYRLIPSTTFVVERDDLSVVNSMIQINGTSVMDPIPVGTFLGADAGKSVTLLNNTGGPLTVTADPGVTLFSNGLLTFAQGESIELWANNNDDTVIVLGGTS